MAISLEEKQKVYEMLGMLGIKDTGDFKADVQKGFEELEILINDIDAEIDTSNLGKAILGSKIDPVKFSDSYSKEDGELFVRGTSQYSEVLDTFLNSINPAINRADKVKGRLSKKEHVPQKYKDDPNLLVDALKKENMQEVADILDKASADGWKVESKAVAEDKKSIVEEKDKLETDAVDKKPTYIDSLYVGKEGSVLRQYEAQSAFVAYKQLIYPTKANDAGQQVSTAPDGQNITGDFSILHYKNIAETIKAAHEFIDDIPNDGDVEDLMEDMGVDRPPRTPKFDTAKQEDIEKWHKEAIKYMKVFTDPKVQEAIKAVGTDWQWVRGGNLKHTINIPKYIPLDRALNEDETSLYKKYTDTMEMALRVDAGLKSGLIGPQSKALNNAEFIGARLSDPNVGYIGLWNPGGQYAIGGVAINEVEQYKNLIGDQSKLGHLASDYADKNYLYINTKIKEVVGSLSEINASLKDEELAKFIEVNKDPSTWAKDDWEQNTANFFLGSAQFKGVLANKVGVDIGASKSFTAFEKNLDELNLAISVNEGFASLDELNTVVDYASRGEVYSPENTDTNNEVQNDVVDQDKNKNPSSESAFSEGDVSQDDARMAGIILESTLKDLAPFLKAQKLDIGADALDLENGKLDEAAQTSFQKLLNGLHMKGIVDLGPDPWNYTPEKGQRIKAALLSEQFQEEYGQELGENVKAKLSEDNLNALIVALDTLEKSKHKDNQLLQTQLVAQSDLLPPFANTLVTIFSIFIPILEEFGIDTSGIVKMISGFTKRFGFDLEGMLPKDESGNAVLDDRFTGKEGMSSTERLKEVYAKALEESGGDSEKLNASIQSAMKDILGEDSKAYKLYSAKGLSSIEAAKEGATPEEKAEIFAKDVSEKLGSAIDEFDLDDDVEPVTAEDYAAVDKMLELYSEKNRYRMNTSTPKDFVFNEKDQNYTPADKGDSIPFYIEDEIEAYVEHMPKGDPNGTPEERQQCVDRIEALAHASREIKGAAYIAQTSGGTVIRANGEVGLVLLDEWRDVDSQVADARLKESKTAIKNYEAKVNAEIKRIQDMEKKLAGNDFTDAKKETEFKQRLANYRKDFAQLLKQGFDKELRTELAQNTELRARMSGTQYRFVPANQAGYATALKRYPHMGSPEKIEKRVKENVEHKRYNRKIHVSDDGMRVDSKERAPKTKNQEFRELKKATKEAKKETKKRQKQTKRDMREQKKKDREARRAEREEEREASKKFNEKANGEEKAPENNADKKQTVAEKRETIQNNSASYAKTPAVSQAAAANELKNDANGVNVGGGN